MSVPFSSGALYSTAEDILRWEEALFVGIEGFNTLTTYVPADKLAAIVLANMNGPAAASIATDLTRIARNETPKLDEDQRKSESALRGSL